MPVKFVNKIGTLNARMPEDNIDPAHAAVAKYFDPFRSEPGTIMPAFGFGANNPTSRPSNWEVDGYPYRVVGAFMMADTQFIITALRDTTTPNFGNGVIYYVDTDGVLQLVQPYFPYMPRILPSRILVDPNVYTMGKTEEVNYREFYNAYIWGYDTDAEMRKPWRLILCKKYANGLGDPDNYEFIFKITKAALSELGSSSLYSLYVAYAGPSEPTGPAIGYYRYYIIIEDICGNWIYLHNSIHFNYNFQSTSGAGVLVRMTIANAKNWGFSKMHVYRDDIAAGEILSDDSFAESRLVGIADFEDDDTARILDVYATQAELTDHPAIGRQELRAWVENANKAFDTIGWHNNALWISLDNEVFFSQYSLDAPFGTRPLNFPSFNRWRFEGIGKIIDILSQNHKLVVMGTEGISILSGDYIDNFYEEKISSVGIDDARPQYGEWIKSAEIIDDKIFFLNREGRICVLFDKVIDILPNILVQKKGTVTDYGPTFGVVEKFQQIDACRYRNGYMITNGDSIYLLDIKSGQISEWVEDVRRFFIGHDPFLETRTVSTTAAAEYKYLEFIDDDGNWRTYLTSGTYPTPIWKTPRLIFEEDQKFNLIIFHWKYNSKIPYGEIDLDSAARTAQIPKGNLAIYLDDRESAVRTYALDFNENSDGTYRFPYRINFRGRKFAFQLSMTAGKYFQLTGWELKHEPVGRKAYA